MQLRANEVRSELTVCEEDYPSRLSSLLEFILDGFQEPKVLIWISREAVTPTCIDIVELSAP